MKREEVVNRKPEIVKLEKELAELEQKQAELEANCEHDWDKPYYDPYEEKEWFLTYRNPEWPEDDYRWIKKDRWTRVCKICGKKEYAYKQVPNKVVPNFH